MGVSVATLPKGWGLDGPRIHSSYGTDHGLSITDTAKALSTQSLWADKTGSKA